MQHIVIPPSPAFKLGWPGLYTKPIPANATVDQVRAALHRVLHPNYYDLVAVKGGFILTTKPPMECLSRLDVVAVDVPIPTPIAPTPIAPRFITGCGAVGTTPQAIGVGHVESLVIRANAANTGIICLGNSPESAAEGYILAGGEACPRIATVDLGAVFLVGSKPNQGFSFITTN